MDEGICEYSDRWEGLLREVLYFFIHLVVTRNDEASFVAANYVTYIEVCGIDIVFSLKVSGSNIVMCIE